MKRVLIIGAGRIGIAIAAILGRSGSYAVTLADRKRPAHVPSGAKFRILDATDGAQLDRACDGHEAIVSAAPFFLNAQIARAAGAGRHGHVDHLHVLRRDDRPRGEGEGRRRRGRRLRLVMT